MFVTFLVFFCVFFSKQKKIKLMICIIPVHLSVLGILKLFNQNMLTIPSFFSTGFPQALEIMENLENYPNKFHAWKNHGI